MLTPLQALLASACSALAETRCQFSGLTRKSAIRPESDLGTIFAACVGSTEHTRLIENPTLTPQGVTAGRPKHGIAPGWSGRTRSRRTCTYWGAPPNHGALKYRSGPSQPVSRSTFRYEVDRLITPEDDRFLEDQSPPSPACPGRTTTRLRVRDAAQAY